MDGLNQFSAERIIELAVRKGSFSKWDEVKPLGYSTRPVDRLGTLGLWEIYQGNKFKA